MNHREPHLTYLEPPPTGIPPKVNNLSKVSLYTLFKWVTDAETLQLVDARLAAIDTRYPTLKAYIKNLARLKHLWARVYQVWQPAFLLKTSNFAENVFWSMKSFINYNFQAVDKLPDVLVLAMQNRQINVAYKQSVKARELPNRLTFLGNSGLGDMCGVISTFLTSAATSFLVGQIQEAMSYDVEEVYADIQSLLDDAIIPRRLSSATRFSILLGTCTYIFIIYEPH